MKRALWDYFEEYSELNLEGFMRFRMQDSLRGFERCVERACEELMIKAECLELMRVLSAFVRYRKSKIAEVSLILNEDAAVPSPTILLLTSIMSVAKVTLL